MKQTFEQALLSLAKDLRQFDKAYGKEIEHHEIDNQIQQALESINSALMNITYHEEGDTLAEHQATESRASKYV